MRRIISFIVFLIILGVIVGYVYFHRFWFGLGGGPSGGGVPTEVSTSTTDQQPARVTWRPVDRSQDGFHIDMPADSSLEQVPAYTTNGGAEQMKMLVAKPNADTTYAVAWDDNPPVERASAGVVEKTLDSARDGALAQTHTTMMAESRTNHLGYPSRDFTARNDSGGLFEARLILAGTRLYMMIVALPAPSARRDEDVTHFFDSFKIEGAAAH